MYPNDELYALSSRQFKKPAPTSGMRNRAAKNTESKGIKKSKVPNERSTGAKKPIHRAPN